MGQQSPITFYNCVLAKQKKTTLGFLFGEVETHHNRHLFKLSEQQVNADPYMFGGTSEVSWHAVVTLQFHNRAILSPSFPLHPGALW